jgi:quercetin dioxygenase-like cupin family protein
MDHTRRDLSVLLPALFAAAQAEAQQQPVLPSKCYEYDSLPVKKNQANHSESRQVFNGVNHEGVSLDVHITLLPAGQMPHPPHHHEWEEIIFIQTGTMEFTINGKTSRGGPGSITYIASNEEHGAKNVGEGPSQYFVLATGRRGRA